MDGSSSVADFLEFRILKEEDLDEVWRFIADQNIGREPICTRLNRSPKDVETARKPAIQESLRRHASIGVFERQNHHKLIAINLNLLGKYIPDVQTHKPSYSDVGIFIEQFYETDELQNITKKREYMEINFFVCHKDWSNKGIGTELYKRAEAIAIQEGCSSIFIIASSFYTQKIVQKFGFVKLKEIFYDDYIDPISETRILEQMPAPHKSCCLLVKYI